MQKQIEFLQGIWDSLDLEYQALQNNVLQLLESKFQKALVAIDGIIGPKSPEISITTLLQKQGEVRRVKYAMRVKESLRSTLDELKSWHDRFDMSWYLMLRNSSPLIDRQLASIRSTDRLLVNGMQNPVFTFKDLRTEIQNASQMNDMTISIPEARLGSARIPIDMSSTRVALDKDRESYVLVDTVRCRKDDNPMEVLSDVRDLARVLSKIDALKFGLLRCHGVIKAWDSDTGALKFEFVFDIPRDMESPLGLRGILMSGSPVPLDERFLLAKLLARSVIFVHAAGFVHKNIRPETIICLQSEDRILGNPVLMGFEKFRLAEGKTTHQSDNYWERNLYRHPKRQGKRPEEDYAMQHDIYSIGVILLEIGLWTSFVHSIDGSSRPVAGPELGIEKELELKDQRRAAYEIQKVLVSKAKDRLPYTMGQRYTQIVVDCLTCLDDHKNSFGYESEFTDRDKILVGIRYIDKVIIQSDFEGLC
ncbi:hypothetical protein MMC12_003566 [Toensbergia leucococca]|nr:hypothetical protein [Toensbergia leucococca]